MIINIYIYSEPLHAKTRFFLYESKDAVTAQHTCLFCTDNSNFLNPKFQATKFCDCVEGILSEEEVSPVAAHVKVVSHNYLKRFSHRTQ